MSIDHKDYRLGIAKKLVRLGLEEKKSDREKYAHQENIGKPTTDNEHYWGTYRTENNSEDARIIWKALAPEGMPNLDEWIQEQVEKLQDLPNKSDRFNVAELGGPGGFGTDLLTKYGQKMGVVAAVSLGDGRPPQVREKQTELGLTFIPGDLVEREVWRKLRSAVSGGKYHFIFANLIGGWEGGIPENPLVHLLMLKRVARLLAPEGVFMSDYFLEGSRSLTGKAQLLEKILNKNPQFQFEVKILPHHIFIRRIR